ncbi:hypothetical protein CASFOL_022738 [Castilleja foliolosa]|uniref:Uncharacterized protein n=1 Tax=Castilleja foliolosa TaxID=1961234 RepID=A0ABD3CXC1_9LAMI
MVANVSRQIKAHWMSLAQSIVTGSRPLKRWIRPPIGILKINVDASFSNGVAHWCGP